MKPLHGLLLLVLAPLAFGQEAPEKHDSEPEKRWWKGNLNAHSLWGDGDALPETVVDWYRTNGYQFAAVVDAPAALERWVPVSTSGPLTDERVLAAKKRFGAEVVRVRTDEAGREVRLSTQAELAARFDAPGRFIVVPGLEQRFEYEDRRVDLLTLGLAEDLAMETPDEGLELIRQVMGAAHSRSQALGRPILTVLQRPNLSWSGRLPELIESPDGFAMEVWSGHPEANAAGDRKHWSLEALWSNTNAWRIPRHEWSPLFAFGGDDARHFHSNGDALATPGRTWLMVRAHELTTDSLLRAMEARDFYVSNGVVLTDIQVDPTVVRVDAEPDPDGRDLLFRFVGSRRSPEGTVFIDQALFETMENPAIFHPSGDELYIRVQVLRTRAPGESLDSPWIGAWTQAYEPYE